jgi:HD-like signal output (HDOD) protein
MLGERLDMSERRTCCAARWAWISAKEIQPAADSRFMPNAGTVPTYRSGTESVTASGAEAAPEERAAALDFLQILAAEVSEGKIDLPCFPDVVVKVSNALANPETPTDRIVTVVGAEPRLAARILQTANSAAFNNSGKPLTDLRSAITRLGQQMVQGTAMSYAMQQVKDEPILRSVAKPLADLWNRSIAVASISQLLAQRCKVRPDEAFVTGLLHGIGKLYIMVRAATRAQGMGSQRPLLELIVGWHASIGKAVLESWSFAEAMCDAIGDQGEVDSRRKHEATLSDVLIAAIVLADALEMPEPRVIGAAGVNAFISIGLTPVDCSAVLAQAVEQIRLVHEALT